MSRQDIVRAWKDEDYRDSLSAEARAELPENPAGLLELSDADLELASGGIGGEIKGTGTGTGSGPGCTCECHC